MIDAAQKKDFVSTTTNLAAETVSAGNISGGRERRTRPASFTTVPVRPPRKSPGTTPVRKVKSAPARKSRDSPAKAEAEEIPASDGALKAKDYIKMRFCLPMFFPTLAL